MSTLDENIYKYHTINVPPGGSHLLGRDRGFVVGSRGFELMRLETDKHMITVANTGGGKGRAVIIPNLLTHEGSIFVVEIGGTAYKETHRYRRAILKQDVHLIDPLNTLGEGSASFNILDTVDIDSDRFITDIYQISESLLLDVDGDRPQDPYWKNVPRDLLAAILIYVKTSPNVHNEDRHLPYVSELLHSYPSESWHDLMMDFAGDSGKYKAFLNKEGNYFRNKDNENTSSIVSTVSTALAFTKDPSFSRMLKTSSFDLRDIRRKRISLYVIMPEIEDFKTNAGFLRGLISRSFNACPNFGDGGRSFGHNDRVLFLLDEFTQLGKLSVVDMGMQTARNKGITIWALFQDIGRLEKVYGKEIAGSFLGAAGCVQVFDVGDERTKQYVSERAGKNLAFIPSFQHGENWGISNQKNWGESIGLGISESLMKGASVAEAETWNFSMTDTVSETDTVNKTHGTTTTMGENTSQTRTNGTSESETYGISQSYMRRLFLWDKRDKKYTISGSQTRQSNASQGATQGTSSSEATSRSASSGSSHGSSHTASRGQGGSRTSGEQTSHTTSTNEQRTNQKGGSTGAQQGGSYSISFTPHILPRFEPSDVEKMLGTNTAQVVFVRAEGTVGHYLDFRSNYDQIPYLRLCAYGPADDLLPVPKAPLLLPFESLGIKSDYRIDFPEELKSLFLNTDIFTQRPVKKILNSIDFSVRIPSSNMLRHISQKLEQNICMVDEYNQATLERHRKIYTRLGRYKRDWNCVLEYMHDFIKNLDERRSSMLNILEEQDFFSSYVNEYQTALDRWANAKIDWPEMRVPKRPKKEEDRVNHDAIASLRMELKQIVFWVGEIKFPEENQQILDIVQYQEHEESSFFGEILRIFKWRITSDNWNGISLKDGISNVDSFSDLIKFVIALVILFIFFAFVFTLNFSLSLIEFCFFIVFRAPFWNRNQRIRKALILKDKSTFLEKKVKALDSINNYLDNVEKSLMNLRSQLRDDAVKLVSYDNLLREKDKVLRERSVFYHNQFCDWKGWDLLEDQE